MERHFGLPIALAAALHGAVLFGVSKSPRIPAPPAAKPEPTRLFPMIPPPEEEVVVPPETADASGERRSLPDTPAPVRGPEPQIEVTTGFKIPVPPIPPGRMIDGPVPPEVLRIGGGDGKNPWGDPVGLALLDNSPRTRFQAAPVYPYSAKRDGTSGEVLVEFVVDETGSVLDPRVVRSTNPVFEESSLRAVAKWKFEPGKRHGQVVRFRMTVPVVFTLSE